MLDSFLGQQLILREKSLSTVTMTAVLSDWQSDIAIGWPNNCSSCCRISLIGSQSPGGAGYREHSGRSRGRRYPESKTSGACQFSSSGKLAAILSPVKLATHPSGLLNSLIAVKLGFGPMSNQCFVLAGTEIKSSFSQSIA